MSLETRNDLLTGRGLLYARLAWVVFALALATVHIAAQIASRQQAATPILTPTQLQGLQAMGLTPEFYSVWKVLWQIPLPLFWGTLGLLIFLLRSNDRAALIMSADMVAFGTIGSIPLWRAFASVYPSWVWVVPFGAFIGNLCFHSFFFFFPNSRFVPRWSWVVVLVFSLINVFYSYDFALPAALVGLRESARWVNFAYLIFAVLFFVGAPYYRYRWVSTVTERQQMKLVLFALAFALALFVTAAVTVFLPGGNPNTELTFITVFVQPLGWVLSLQLIPVAIAVSILRYRLFDIDLIIRRTFIYSLVTASLALVYFGGVVVLQGLFRSLTGAGDDLAIILSTLAIAALFNPLRRRIQDAIDRRFYRRKYDAQQVLAGFAKTARDKIELDGLTSELIRVTDETLHPESTSIWLNRVGSGERRGAE